jgi:zinc transporter 9
MSKNSHGTKSVVAALVGNATVTIAKLVAATASGSAVMFAESIHSLADTLNQGLLAIGIKRSKKLADEQHAYGYGNERFFWAVISACGVLFIGAGVTVMHAVESLLHPVDGVATVNMFSVCVLMFALVVEGATLLVAMKEIKGTHDNWSKEVFEDADPVTLAVVYEDGVAVFGVLAALLAQAMIYLTGSSVYDSLGALFIGILLAILAVLLIKKNHSYILGRALPDDMKEEIIELLEQDACIGKVINLKSSSLDVGKYKLQVEVEWNGSPLMTEMYEGRDLEEEFDWVKDDYPEFLKLMIRMCDRVPRLVGSRIDEIEKRIRAEYPEIEHIDIELN